MYTLSLAGAMSLVGAAAANAANVFNPTYMPKAGEGYVKGGTAFVMTSEDAETTAGKSSDKETDDGLANVNSFGFEFGYGIFNGLTLKVANNTAPRHGSYSYSMFNNPETTLALNYRILDDQNKLDVYFAWDVQFADKDADYDSNWVNLGVKFGQDLGNFAYNVGAEINYALSAETEGFEDDGTGTGKFIKVKRELDSGLMYGLNADLMYKFNDKLSGNFDLALTMYSDLDETSKGEGVSYKKTYEYDLSYKAGLALNYQLRENTTLRGKLAYETLGSGEWKDNGEDKGDTAKSDDISLGFEVAVAF